MVAPVGRVVSLGGFGRLHARLRWLTFLVAVMLVASMAQSTPAQAKPKWQPPATQDVPGIPVANVTPGQAPATAAWSAAAEKAAVRAPVAVSWPSGTAMVELPEPVTDKAATGPDGAPQARTEGRAVVAGGLPVSVAAGPKSGSGRGLLPSRVSVTAWDRAAVGKAGRDGVVLALDRADGASASAPVTVQVSYAGFAGAFGGDWASRLRLVSLPWCAATDPGNAACRAGAPVGSVNDPAAKTLTATVDLGGDAPMLLATEAGASGDNGDYTATGLAPAGTWQVSTQTGAFSWSLPMRMPPALGGPSPSLSLSYSSGSVDGRTATTNNQGGWIGDGWDMWPGSIDRTYASCADDNPSHVTGDQCWYAPNATLSLNGHAGELIQDGGVWRLKADDGTKAELLTDSARGNGDNDNEYWKVTTTDGVQYFFGYHKLPGWTSGNAVTDSVWTTPVYGNNSGEPCNGSTYSSSWCMQAWRWNLDYVVDPNGNTMAYFYGKETGAYGRNNNTDGRTTYDRGGYLQRIEYGMRAGSEYAQAAPLRVVLDTAERCLSGCWSGTAWTSDPVTSAWPDTPWDQYCKTAPCTQQTSPTFWSARRLTKVTTQTRNGTSTYADVESWTLRHEFLGAGAGEGIPMWLRGVTHAGLVTSAGGAVTTDPEIVFGPGSDPLRNRVDGVNGNRTGLFRWRIKEILTESGSQIQVTYSEPADNCVATALPQPETNTTRCMPSFYAPEGASEPSLDWFHKYVVTRVDVSDLATDQPATTVWYDYLDSPAWAYNKDELTKDKYRTWGDWRGYGQVRVRQGLSGGVQTAVETRYLRGMDGDKAPSQPGGVRDVWVADTWGGSTEDHEALQGFTLETITYNGMSGASPGPEVTSTVNTPWLHGPTATRVRNGNTTQAWVTQTATARTRTALAAGGFRTTKTSTAFTDEGLPSTVDDFGDEAASGDETCTRTTYNRNDTIWMIDKVGQTETLSGTCAAASTPAAPATVLSRSRTAYDAYSGETSFTTAPTRGNPVRVEVLDHWNGSTPVYVASTQDTTYDDNGRVLSVTDALGKITTTSYTTANGGLVVGSTVTNPLQQSVVTVKHPAWDLPTKTTDPNGAVTELTYDGAGRLTAVWLPGRNKANQSANLKFTYLLRNSGGPTAVTTETLLPTGSTYKKSVNLYDGLLRQRQAQIQATGGGRLLTDTFYDTLGNEAWTSAAYYDNTGTAPGTTLGTPQGQIPSITQHQYDGVGRVTADIFLANGVEKWRTTTVYGGDRTSTVPPDGGVATTAITNAFGETVELRQYHNRTDAGSDDPADFDATHYTYDLSGSLTQVDDPAGNRWSYTYDLHGRQVSAADPDKGTTTTTYDAADHVLTTTSPLGTGTATLAYTYDDLGRKTTLRDGSVTGPKRAEWVYDTTAGGIGKLSKSYRYTDGKTYETRVDNYDSAGRALSTTLVLPASEGGLCAAGGATPCQYTTSVTYRPNGATNRSTMPAAANLPAETLIYGYNDIGEQTTLLSAAQTYVYAVTYDKLGQLLQRQLGAYGYRVAVTSTFDEPTRRLTSSNVVPELQAEAANWSYTYDDNGDLTKIVEAAQGQSADTQCFGYDYLTRLQDAWTPANGTCTTPSTASLGGPAPYWHSWTYDLSGNRRTETRHHSDGDTTDTYTYPTPGANAVRPHAVTQVQTAAPGSTTTRGYTYDAAGNTATRTSAAGNQQSFTYDAEGHLATVVENGVTSTNIYDADGTRLIRRDASGSVLYLPGGTEVKLPTGSSTAGAMRYYTHRDTTIAMRTTAGVTWLVGDHQNTAQLSIDKTSLAVTKRRTLPFGGERGSATGWPSAMDKGFVGGTNDSTGLTHLGLREYDPVIGRFLSVDPVIDVSQPHQLNPYNYSNHNPVTQADPTGEWPSFIAKAASAVASAVSTAANAVVNTVASTVESIKEDPLKFAVGLAVGIAATAAVAAVCATGVGCLILAGAVAGAAAAGAEYGVDVAQGEREFSVGDLAKEMAIGGAIGAATAGLGVGGSKLASGARNAFRRGASKMGDDIAEDAAAAGRNAAKPATPAKCGVPGAVAMSFSADTRVLLATGAAIAIAALTNGDMVLTTDPQTGQTSAQPVTALFANVDLALADVTVTNPDGTTAVVHTTQNHPFWDQTTHDWVQAGDLQPGDKLLTPEASSTTVVKVDLLLHGQVMYNLAVNQSHTYYVIAGNTPILVHNRPDDLTPDQIKDIAKFLGLRKLPTRGKDAVYLNPKPRAGEPRYLSPDIDQHNGAVFKGANTVKDLGSKTTRMGGYGLDIDGNGMVQGLEWKCP